jgi:hypothetical protein
MHATFVVLLYYSLKHNTLIGFEVSLMISSVNPSILARKGAAASLKPSLLTFSSSARPKASTRSDCALHKRFNELFFTGFFA